MHKTLYRLGFIPYILLILMATLFYKERTVFMDAAYHLFHFLMNDDFAIQHNRFGAAVTQVFPVLGSHLGLPLKSIMLLYSTGTMLYYFLCYFVCGTILKQYKFALLVLMFSILFATDTFFWPFSELQQGCTMLMVMFSLLNTRIQLALKYLLILVLIVTLSFIHPLIIIPASFVFTYLIILKESNVPIKEVVLCFIIFISVYLIKFFAFKTPYDTQAGNGSHYIINNLRTGYFNLYSVQTFFHNCTGKFFWISVFFVSSVVFYIVKRRWLLLGFYSISVLGFISLVNLSYPDSGVPSFYIENLYLPVSIMLSVPIIFEGLASIPRKNAAIGLLVLLAFSSTYRIYNQRSFYKGRLDWLRGYYTAHKGEKLIVSQSKTPIETLIFSWGSPYEFWLLSTLETGNTASIIISENPEQLKWASPQTKSFIATWGVIPYKEFPKNYFNFNDTTAGYSFIE